MTDTTARKILDELVELKKDLRRVEGTMATKAELQRVENTMASKMDIVRLERRIKSGQAIHVTQHLEILANLGNLNRQVGGLSEGLAQASRLT